MFDFVNPVLALGWLINRGRKLWLDESKPGMKHARHDGFSALKRRSPDGGCQGFFRSFERREMMMAGKPSPRPNYNSDNFGQQAYAKKPRSTYRGF